MKNEEHRIQSAAIEELSKYTRFDWLFAIPNGGARDPITGARLRREGVRSGVWDLFFPQACYARNTEGDNSVLRYGLWIEVKSETGYLTAKQAEFGLWVYKQGYAIAICRNSKSIIETCWQYSNNGYWQIGQALHEVQKKIDLKYKTKKRVNK